MYSIEYSKEAIKQLYKLEKETQKRIVAALDRIQIRPYPHVVKLVGCPYFRLRVGKYRVILKIVDNKLQIFVIEVGHRKNIYK